jgi:hypothetical protein
MFRQLPHQNVGHMPQDLLSVPAPAYRYSAFAASHSSLHIFPTSPFQMFISFQVSSFRDSFTSFLGFLHEFFLFK